MLTTIPDGVVCYLDATIFYYHLVDAPPLSDDCSDLLTRIERARVQGVTSSVAILEAAHKVMLAEVVQRHGVDHRGLIARLKRHPELLDGLTNHQRVAATVRSLRLPVEAITLELLARGAALDDILGVGLEPARRPFQRSPRPPSPPRRRGAAGVGGRHQRGPLPLSGMPCTSRSCMTR